MEHREIRFGVSYKASSGHHLSFLKAVWMLRTTLTCDLERILPLFHCFGDTHSHSQMVLSELMTQKTNTLEKHTSHEHLDV